MLQSNNFKCCNSTLHQKLEEIKSDSGINAVWNCDDNVVYCKDTNNCSSDMSEFGLSTEKQSILSDLYNAIMLCKEEYPEIDRPEVKFI
jgi:hypothetical protein